MNIRVLIIDDSEDDALLIERNLKQQGYIVTFERVDTSEGLKSALHRVQWDVVLTDYSMPHFSGLSALALIRMRDINIPVIVISGVVGEDTAVNMMRAGANDYIMKNNLIRLAPAIERELAEAKIRLQKHRADITIAQQRNFLFTVIDSLDHPFFVIDANDYTVELANKAVKESNTWENGITCYSLTHNRQSPCDCQQYPCPLKEVVSTGKSIIVEHTHYDKDGKGRDVEVHAYPIFDSEGNVVQIIEYCLDITERRRAEEKASKLEAELAVFKERLTFLTDREHDVMLLVGAGKANKVIALELGISHKTVEIHRGRVMKKLKLDSVADLVRYLTKLEIAP